VVNVANNVLTKVVILAPEHLAIVALILVIAKLANLVALVATGMVGLLGKKLRYVLVLVQVVLMALFK
jgi:hypothetical protein